MAVEPPDTPPPMTAAQRKTMQTQLNGISRDIGRIEQKVDALVQERREDRDADAKQRLEDLAAMDRRRETDLRLATELRRADLEVAAGAAKAIEFANTGRKLTIWTARGIGTVISAVVLALAGWVAVRYAEYLDKLWTVTGR